MATIQEMHNMAAYLEGHGFHVAALSLRQATSALLVRAGNENLSPKQQKYQEFFRNKMSQYGVNSPTELSDEKKSQFFNEIKQEWNGDDAQEALSALLTVLGAEAMDPVPTEPGISQQEPADAFTLHNDPKDDTVVNSGLLPISAMGSLIKAGIPFTFDGQHLRYK